MALLVMATRLRAEHPQRTMLALRRAALGMEAQVSMLARGLVQLQSPTMMVHTASLPVSLTNSTHMASRPLSSSLVTTLVKVPLIPHQHGPVSSAAWMLKATRSPVTPGLTRIFPLSLSNNVLIKWSRTKWPFVTSSESTPRTCVHHIHPAMLHARAL